MRLAGCSAKSQPPVNMLFGAVGYLLLSGVEHPLAAHYPSVDGEESPSETTYELFADFCAAHAEAIEQIVATRRVQTNEVGRGAMLLVAFSLVWERYGRRPLHLIELGCSAGLNLRLDRYHHEWVCDGSRRACGPVSRVRLRTELRDGDAPVPSTMPEIAGRVGVDMAPADVTDLDAMRWIESLIWPDNVDRLEQYRAAVALARVDPPQVFTGDGLETIPELVARVPEDRVPCVYHSHAIYQMTSAWQEQFTEMLGGLGAGRDLAHVSLEWLLDDPGPQLHLTTFESGHAERRHLADCHHHGRWMRWLGTT